MAQKIGMPGGSVSMSSRTADKLISGASGDAALLFLYLLRTSGNYDPTAAAKALSRSSEQIMRSFAELEKLELVKGIPVEKPPVPDTAQAPEYSAEMISHEIADENSAFRALVSEVERKLGDQLSPQNLRILMELYDYLALPPEVIYLLVSYMTEEIAFRKGHNVRPKMWEIKREAYRWSRSGIDSLDAATAYVEKMNYFRSKEGQVLAAVGIRDRTAQDREKTYIHSWLEMDFSEGVIELAYEKTLFHTRAWNWNYCNGILKNWNAKGLHTLEQIAAAEQQNRSPRPAAGAASSAASAPQQADNMDDLMWIQQYLNSHKTGGTAG